MYIVVGGTGFLCAYVVQCIVDKTKERVLVVARKPVSYENVGGITDSIQFKHCNVVSREDIDNLITEINMTEEPCKIIYLAASLHPEEVERNPWNSWNTNVISLEYLLSGMKRIEAFIFASTDSVYGSGTLEHRFREDERLAPVNLYGTQKMAGESIVNHYGYSVLRYSLMLGPSIIKGKKHFYDNLVETLKSGKQVELFEDSYRSTIDFRTAAELTVKLLLEKKESLPSVLNIAGDEALSKYDVGRQIAKRLGVSEELLIPIKVSDGGHIYNASRAACTLLDNSKLKKLLNLSEIKMQFEV